MSEIEAARQRALEQQRWLRILGILLMILGGIALLATFTATMATVVLFGLLLLVGGVAQLVHAMAPRSENVGWEVFGGALYAVVGGLLLFDPVSGAIGLTLLLAIFFMAIGVLRLTLGFQMRQLRGIGAGGLILTGSLDLLLGFLIVVGWPAVSMWVIGLFLGIELLVAGAAIVFLTSAARRIDVPA
ncbi:MAG: HdeD family acid-resistance protein [bacterium]